VVALGPSVVRATAWCMTGAAAEREDARGYGSSSVRRVAMQGADFPVVRLASSARRKIARLNSELYRG